MFTGIVAAVGRVTEPPTAANGGSRLAVKHAETATTATLGSSVAVNGVCLTVTAVDAGRGTFSADVVPETLARTNLGRLRPGDPVNLEPSLRMDQGLDGHLVQGHVDGAAAVLAVEDVELGSELTIELPPNLARYVAEKGSIAVDGTSLTVAAIGAGQFRVALIPHTLTHTIAHTYRTGSIVNLEVDVIARYAERLLRVK